MKKKLILLPVLCLCSIMAICQVNPDENNWNGGGFASLNFNVSSVDSKAAFFTGGGGGFIIKNIRLGAFFSGLVSKVSIKDQFSENEFRFSASHYGLWIGYPIFNSRSLHALVDLKLFVGNANTTNANNTEIDNRSFFYGFTPSIGAEYNISDIFAISAGFDYRFSIFPSNPNLYSKSILNGPGIYVSLKLGLF